MILLEKAFKFFKSKNKYISLISFLNRTFLRFPLKLILCALNFNKLLARKNYLNQLQFSLMELQKSEELQKNGFCIVTEIADPKLLAELETHSAIRQKESLSANSAVPSAKDFWVHLSDQEIQNSESPFVKFALQESFLKIAGHYLKQVPFLEYVLLTLSKGSSQDYKASQLWHRDYDNVGMLKLFVYLTNVPDSRYGPFTFLGANASINIKTKSWKSHLPDQEVDQSNLHALCLPKGSVFMVDTSRCLHMGSRLEPGLERLMYTALYLQLPSIYPWNGNSKTLISSSVSELQRKALCAR